MLRQTLALLQTLGTLGVDRNASSGICCDVQRPIRMLAGKVPAVLLLHTMANLATILTP